MLPPEITLSFVRMEWDEFVRTLMKCEKIINYVRHKPTNDLLSSVVSFETGVEYRINASDVIFLLGLKTRAPTPGADVNVSPSDLLIYLAKPV
jgi:hypothetical protein